MTYDLYFNDSPLLIHFSSQDLCVPLRGRIAGPYRAPMDRRCLLEYSCFCQLYVSLCTVLVEAFWAVVVRIELSSDRVDLRCEHFVDVVLRAQYLEKCYIWPQHHCMSVATVTLSVGRGMRVPLGNVESQNTDQSPAYHTAYVFQTNLR